MKYIPSLVLLLASLAFGQSAGTPPAPATKKPVPPVAQSVKQIDARTPALPPFAPQQPKRIELANGMVIFLQEDHELPLIDGFARIHGGGVNVENAKRGMMGVYGEVWRTGGTKDKTGDELDDFLEARAASVETSASDDSTTISFNSLKQDFPAVFAIFTDLLRTPEFRQEKIDLAKQQIATVIARRNEDPSGIAQREAAKIVYGPESPYGRVPEFWTVGAITREGLVAFHDRFVHPNNIILGIVGDFDSAQMEQQLRKAFESWPKAQDAEMPKIPFAAPQPELYLAQKEDVNQSNIMLVTLGIRRDNPDYFATRVLNEALAGGFSSRMFTSLRTRQGLAYSVGGGIGYSFDHPGAVEFVIGTKSETTVKAIEAMRKEIAEGVTRPFTEDEVRAAKANILNSFIFRFDSKEKVLGEKVAYEFFHYPLDTLERFRKEIEKITPEDVNRVAKKYLKPEQLAVVVVGNPADFDKPLSTLGPVKTLDISIPTAPPASEAGAAKP